MSSSEAEETPAVPVPSSSTQRKKKPRACDYCRRKKIRCDGAEMPDRKCSRCIGQGIDCTYEPINTRPPSKSYVQILENRLQNMERLFSQLHPNVQIPKDFDRAVESGQWPVAPDPLPATSSNAHTPPSASASAISPPPPDSPTMDSDELESSEDEREVRTNIIKNFKRIPVPSSSVRYHGKSSSMMFLQTVLQARQSFTGEDEAKSGETVPRNPRTSLLPPGDNPSRKTASFIPGITARSTGGGPVKQEFPSPDLMQALVDLYFTHFNDYLPLLHRPTFDKGIRENRHLRDEAFGAVVLLVCANGARWHYESHNGPDDAGWIWFKQVDTARWSLLDRPRLEDLQSCSLVAFYLSALHTPQGAWLILGLGLRMAQDVGVHRKKMYSSIPRLEDELWKRAFWVLVVLDRVGSFGLGRPSAIHDEDFDVDIVREIDDEFWVTSESEIPIKQPEGKPSKLTFFNGYCRLTKILAFASRTIYSINKSKLTHGFVGPEWEQRTVAELDSALNKWLDTVPEHLRWDPNRDDRLFMNQSASLYAHYYLLQICVHRPFISSLRKPSRISFPSLTICTNAARSCAHVLDLQRHKTGDNLWFNRLPMFTAGLVLLLNMWGGKRSGVSNQSTLADVQKCLDSLHALAPYSYGARRLWTVLTLLLNKETSAREPPTCTKEKKMDVSDIFERIINQNPAQRTAMMNDPSLTAQPPEDHALSPLYNPPIEPTPASQTPQTANGNAYGEPFTENTYALPLSTADLGRVPWHHGFTSPFAPTQHAAQFFQNLLLQQSNGPNMMPQGDSASHNGPVSSIVENMPAVGTNFGSDGFPMLSENYSQLLSALSAPTGAAYSPDTQGQGEGQGQAHGQDGQMDYSSQAPAPFSNMDVDMETMSAENLAFADNMFEMWSTAPTSLEWGDWGAYISNVTGMTDTENMFYQQPS